MKQKEESEQELLRKLRKKDQLSWKTLYERHAGHLTFIAVRYVKSMDNARDVLQDAFIKMFHHIETFSFQGKGSLLAWMRRIVVNESLMHLRSQILMEELEDSKDQITEAETDFTLGDISQDEILSAIQSLPDGYRVIFNLYVFEEKSHKEIAELLGIKENSSASQLHRAKKMLAEKITSLKNTK